MIVEKHLLSSEQIPGVTVDSYVIMPDHIHVIFIIEPQSEDKGRRGAAPYQAPSRDGTSFGAYPVHGRGRRLDGPRP